MVIWKPFDVANVIEEGEYLVTDGENYDIASLQNYSGQEMEWFLSERTTIDGIGAVTHFVQLHLPNEVHD